MEDLGVHPWTHCSQLRSSELIHYRYFEVKRETDTSTSEGLKVSISLPLCSKKRPRPLHCTLFPFFFPPSVMAANIWRLLPLPLPSSHLVTVPSVLLFSPPPSVAVLLCIPLLLFPLLLFRGKGGKWKGRSQAMNTKRKVDGKGFPIKEKEKRDLCVSKEKQTNLGLLRGVCFGRGSKGALFGQQIGF